MTLRLAPLTLLLGAAPAAAPPPEALPVKAVDAAQLGTVIATLNDWRAILVVAFAIIGVLILMVGAQTVMLIRMAATRSANDQATLGVLQEATRAMSDQAASLRALEVIAARREAERS